jgi:hypothetical protein
MPAIVLRIAAPRRAATTRAVTARLKGYTAIDMPYSTWRLMARIAVLKICAENPAPVCWSSTRSPEPPGYFSACLTSADRLRLTRTVDLFDKVNVSEPSPLLVTRSTCARLTSSLRLTRRNRPPVRTSSSFSV